MPQNTSPISPFDVATLMRHPQEGAARLATEFSGGVPVLDAGDGANLHPDQTAIGQFTTQQ
ncbi:hypothetical protein ACLBVW_38810, partial [Pseudomonas aeruginosa]